MDNDQNVNQQEQQYEQAPQNQQYQDLSLQGQPMQNQQQYQNQQPVMQNQQFQQQQQNQYQQNQYQNPQYQNMGMLLKTDRSLVKFILLSIVTLGIYSIIFYTGIANDINRVASGRDGKKTTHFCLATFILAPITCSIYMFYWWHTTSDRIGEEARARGIYTDFSSTTFWLWQLVGAVLCGIGPFIYIHKLCTVMNQINASYNQYGR